MKIFEMTSKTGKAIRIEGVYRKYMRTMVSDIDGYMLKKEEPYEEGMLTAYVDGKKVDSVNQVEFWRVVDTVDGLKKIWGMRIGFFNPADAERYEIWLAALKDEGNECKEYDEQVRKKEAEVKLAYAKEIVRQAERQRDIPDAKEAKRRMVEYNRINNEGGEGFVPHIISREEYEEAKSIIAKA